MRRRGDARAARAAAGAVLLLSAFACSRAPRDPVAACLNEIVAAAEKRDADGVLARVAESFRDAEGGGKADAALLVRRSLAGYESLSLSITDLAAERGGASAQAKFVVKMSGRPKAVGGLEGLLPRSSRWRFDVRLASGKDGWTITDAAWTRLGDD